MHFFPGPSWSTGFSSRKQRKQAMVQPRRPRGRRRREAFGLFSLPSLPLPFPLGTRDREKRRRQRGEMKMKSILYGVRVRPRSRRKRRGTYKRDTNGVLSSWDTETIENRSTMRIGADRSVVESYPAPPSPSPPSPSPAQPPPQSSPGYNLRPPGQQTLCRSYSPSAQPFRSSTAFGG